MRIGKVYANAEREEDREDQTLIEMGAIAGEGSLCVVIEAVCELVEESEWCVYYRGDSPHKIDAEAKREAAWLALFAALRAIEVQSEKTQAAIEEARYALVGGNLDGPIPPRDVDSWLTYIKEMLDG